MRVALRRKVHPVLLINNLQHVLPRIFLLMSVGVSLILEDINA